MHYACVHGLIFNAVHSCIISDYDILVMVKMLIINVFVFVIIFDYNFFINTDAFLEVYCKKYFIHNISECDEYF